MLSRSNRSFVSVLVLAALTPAALSQSAGQPEAVATTSDPIAQAQTLADEGQTVRAQALLRRLTGADAGTLSDADRLRAMGLLTKVEGQIARTDRHEVSVQKASMALDDGDIRQARRQARAVANRTDAPSKTRLAAEELLARANARLEEIQPRIGEVLAKAESDFYGKRYAESKAALDMAYRSDAMLTPDQQATYDKFTLRIMEVEHQQGRMFDTAGMDAGLMAVIQPGQVRRPGEPAPAPSNPAPEPAPEVVPIAAQPVAEPVREVVVAQPEPIVVPPPEPAPNASDIVRQSMQLDAQRIMAEAEAAMSAGSFQAAARKWRQLQVEYRDYLTPDQMNRVTSQLGQAEVRIGTGSQPLEEETKIREIEKQRILAEYNNFLAQAGRAQTSGEIERARGQVNLAKLTINSGRGYFSEPEYQSLLDKANEAEAAVNKSAEEIRIADADRRAKEMEITAGQTQTERAAERSNKINELLERARAHQMDLRYEDSLESVNQLLFMDPNNPAGLLLRDALQDIIIYRRSNLMRKDQIYKESILALDAQESMQPPTGMVSYPLDWPAISYSRGEQAEFSDTPATRQLLAEMENKRVPRVDFPDGIGLADAIDFIKTSAGNPNMDADWSALDGVGVTRDTQVSLTLVNVSVRSLLDRLVAKVNSSSTGKIDWTVEDGMVILSSDAAIRAKTSLVIYDVRDLLVDVPDYDRVPNIDLQTALQSSQGGGNNPFRNDQQNDDQRRQQRITERQNRLDDLIQIIQENIDEDWIDQGGSTGKLRKHSAGSLIITNTPKAHRRIIDLLSKLRAVRAMQINVETRFLLVNQDFFEQIGFDLDVYFNTNNNQVRVARGTDPSIQGSDFFDFSGRGLLRDVGGSAFRTAPTAPGTGGTIQRQGVVNPRGWSPIGAAQDHLGIAGRIAPQSDWAQSILGGAPAMGIAGQFLDDIQVDFLVKATQADRRSVQLTAPRVTFTNGQTSNIFVATQQAFVSDLAPIVQDSAVGFDPTVAVVSEGVSLLVNGTVTSDRRYVQMNIETGIARIDGFAQQPVTAVAGGQLVNSADTQSFIQLPTTTVTRVQTTVSVPDQGTLLLGGQRLITEFEVESGVPVLSKIPVINRLFTNRIMSKESQTLLILVKPTVLIQNEQEEKSFPGLADKIRSGLGG